MEKFIIFMVPCRPGRATLPIEAFAKAIKDGLITAYAHDDDLIGFRLPEELTDVVKQTIEHFKQGHIVGERYIGTKNKK